VVAGAAADVVVDTSAAGTLVVDVDPATVVLVTVVVVGAADGRADDVSVGALLDTCRASSSLPVVHDTASVPTAMVTATRRRRVYRPTPADRWSTNLMRVTKMKNCRTRERATARVNRSMPRWA